MKLLIDGWRLLAPRSRFSANLRTAPRSPTVEGARVKIARIQKEFYPTGVAGEHCSALQGFEVDPTNLGTCQFGSFWLGHWARKNREPLAEVASQERK